jgi:transporter family-2 protein
LEGAVAVTQADANPPGIALMGSTYFTATTVTCSLVCAVLLDHMGWIGFEVHRVNLWRITGCALLLAGLFLVSKF